MNITNIGQRMAAANLQSAKLAATSNANKLTNANLQESGVSTVDMRNVSLNEINALIKVGVKGLLDIVPAMPVSIDGAFSSEDAANIKVDYLGQIEGYIAFDKSQGKDTAFLEQVLSNIKKIDGMKLTAKVDVMA